MINNLRSFFFIYAGSTTLNGTHEVTFLKHKCTYKGFLQDCKKYGHRYFPICITTDASKHVCKDILIQLPIAYVSRSFRKEKSNKNATGQELTDIFDHIFT